MQTGMPTHHVAKLGQSRCVNRSALANTRQRCDEVCPSPPCWDHGRCVNRHAQAVCAVLGHCVGVTDTLMPLHPRLGHGKQESWHHKVPVLEHRSRANRCTYSTMLSAWDLTDTRPCLLMPP